MQNPKSFKTIYSLLVSLLLVGTLIGCTVLPDEGQVPSSDTEESQLPQPKTLTDPLEVEINSAIQKAALGREDVLAFIVFRVTLDRVQFSPEKNLALAWISMVDKQTGLVQNSEPGLVIVHATGDPLQPWRVTFQVDPNFAEELIAIPEDMLSTEMKMFYMPAKQQEQKDGVVYRGYKLPWTKGQTVNLTGSIGHVFTYKSCPSTCLYAFDFANGTMFDIKAAKHGYVKYVKWSYANGNTTNPNYIVLEDRSTTPVTYQVYYHLAQDSVPAPLRVIGAEVAQGQFIGKADDTGYSTGNHLHFHVHTAPNSVWGTSVDIVFDEVSINGGRPRTCTEASAYPEYGKNCTDGNRYVSQNGDVAPPTGAITNPQPYAAVTSPTLNVSGWMQDDTAVESGQLMINAGRSWTPIGLPVTVTPFTREIDLCQAGIPNGKFFLSIVVTDKAGKVSTETQGLTELTKNYDCPALPPACTPAENQMALYTDAEYQGTCKVFDVGSYKNLGSLDPSFLDNTRSIQVGSGVTALLYPDPDFGGTFELFQDGDGNLADNLIGAYNTASMKVLNRVNPPEPPTLELPEIITTNLDLTLRWTAAEGVQTSSVLTGPDGFIQTLDWQEGGSWQVGLLPEGDYQWTVEARNLAGTATITQEFPVIKASILPLTHLNPLPQIVSSSAVLLTWEIDQGADGIDHFELQTQTPGNDWVDYPVKPGKDDRQLVYWGKPGKTVLFRLRAVDIIGNGEEFLSVAEVGTLFVDGCLADEYDLTEVGDSAISRVTLLEVGNTQTHNWCVTPSQIEEGITRDVDWVSFTATAGQQLRLTTKPVDLASAALLTLYEPDGVTLIGEARPSNASASASLDWTAPVDGTYFVKLTSLDDRITGTDTHYEFGIELKGQLQPGTLIGGGAAIPALLAGGYAVSKQVKRQKRRMERKVMGR